MSKERFLYWSPRILAIVYVVFLSIFALDVFTPNKTLSYYFVAFIMHLIPNFILLALLIIAWKYEKFGALLFSLAFLMMLKIFWNQAFIWQQFILFCPLLLISLLFFIHNPAKKSNQIPHIKA